MSGFDVNGRGTVTQGRGQAVGQAFEVTVPSSTIWRPVVEDAGLNDGNSIDTIPDRYGSNPLQSQQSTKATYVADGINGYAAAQFDKNDSGSLYQASGLSSSQPTAYVYVVHFTPQDTSNNRYFTDGINSRNICAQIDNNNQDGIGMWASNWVTTSTYSSDPAIYTFDFGINDEIRQNGSTIVSGDPGGNSLDGIELDSGQSVDGLFAEGFALDNPTSQELRDLESDLGTKYGISV